MSTKGKNNMNISNMAKKMAGKDYGKYINMLGSKGIYIALSLLAAVVLIVVLLVSFGIIKVNIDTKDLNNISVSIDKNNKEDKTTQSKKEKAVNKTAEEKELSAYINGERVKAKVVKVKDGDTITANINGKEYTVRMIGVDTPESVHPDKTKNTPFGKVASDYTKKRLMDKEIELQKDVSGTDKYGRLLAYVYLEGNMYNEELVKEGYAKMATFPPDVKNVEKFRELQEEAKKAKKGVWK